MTIDKFDQLCCDFQFVNKSFNKSFFKNQLEFLVRSAIGSLSGNVRPSAAKSIAISPVTHCYSSNQCRAASQSHVFILLINCVSKFHNISGAIHLFSIDCTDVYVRESIQLLNIVLFFYCTVLYFVL